MSNDDQRLAPLRAQIDAIDQELLELISKRARPLKKSAILRMSHLRLFFVLNEKIR